jgi:hypothetical protein
MPLGGGPAAGVLASIDVPTSADSSSTATTARPCGAASGAASGSASGGTKCGPTGPDMAPSPVASTGKTTRRTSDGIPVTERTVAEASRIKNGQSRKHGGLHAPKRLKIPTPAPRRNAVRIVCEEVEDIFAGLSDDVVIRKMNEWLDKRREAHDTGGCVEGCLDCMGVHELLHTECLHVPLIKDSDNFEEMLVNNKGAAAMEFVKVALIDPLNAKIGKKLVAKKRIRGGQVIMKFKFKKISNSTTLISQTKREYSVCP